MFASDADMATWCEQHAPDVIIHLWWVSLGETLVVYDDGEMAVLDNLKFWRAGQWIFYEVAAVRLGL